MLTRFAVLVATPARSAVFQGLFCGVFWIVGVLLGLFGEGSSLAGGTVSAVFLGLFTGVVQWRLLRRAELRQEGSPFVALEADDRVRVVRAIREGRSVDDVRLAAAVVDRVEQSRPRRSSLLQNAWFARLIFLGFGGGSVAALLLLLDDSVAATVFALLVGGFWATVLVLSFAMPTWRDPAVRFALEDRAEAEARRLLEAGSAA
jgi:hypothetical protein